jgi:hypothetical protein
VVTGGSNTICSSYATISNGSLNQIINGSSGSPAIYEEGVDFIGSATNSVIKNLTFVGGIKTIFTGKQSIISGSNNWVGVEGCSNDIQNGFNSMINGFCNTIGSRTFQAVAYKNCYNFMGNGCNNLITGADYSSILNGRTNCVCAGASHGSILGGINNFLCQACSFIAGANITSDRACTLFANNLSLKTLPTSAAGLPSGSVWYCSTDCSMRIVP